MRPRTAPWLQYTAVILKSVTLYWLVLMFTLYVPLAFRLFLLGPGTSFNAYWLSVLVCPLGFLVLGWIVGGIQIFTVHAFLLLVGAGVTWFGFPAHSVLDFQRQVQAEWWPKLLAVYFLGMVFFTFLKARDLLRVG